MRCTHALPAQSALGLPLSRFSHACGSLDRVHGAEVLVPAVLGLLLVAAQRGDCPSFDPFPAPPPDSYRSEDLPPEGDLPRRPPPKRLASTPTNDRSSGRLVVAEKPAKGKP